VIVWVRSLPGPSAVVYEAGPTGFGLARAFVAAGIRWEVAAPSKIQCQPYQDLGADYYIRRDPEATKRRIIRQANDMGLTVRFDPIEHVS
jgi:hypothetical protein